MRDIFDKDDLMIARMLDRDSRASNRELARQLRISESTVRIRLERLFASGVLKMAAYLDPGAMESGHTIDVAIVLVKQRNPTHLTINMLKNNPQVLFVAAVTGQFSFIFGIVVNSKKMLGDFINTIKEIESVYECYSFAVVENKGLYVPPAVLFNMIYGEARIHEQDAVNLRIAACLDSNLRFSNRKIAAELGISRATVKKRIDDMVESGMLKITAMVDLEKIPELENLHVAIIGIRPYGTSHYTVENMSRISTGIFVVSMTGIYDMFVMLASRSKKMLMATLTHLFEERFKAVDTETFLVLSSVGVYVPATVLHNVLNMSFDEYALPIEGV